MQRLKIVKQLAKAMAVTSLVVSVSACSQQSDKSDGKPQAVTTTIMGSGSSFIYPAMSRWANSYYEKTGVQLSYQPIGSGGGQRQIFAGTVNFAASDQPLTTRQLEKYDLIQFPAIVGGIVPVVNIPDVKANQLTLSGQVLADIYLGKITYWDDAAIKTLNPNVNLPHKAIITVHRADGSGTTYNFAKYLASISPNWQTKVGVDTSLQWPNGIGAKGNQGVAAQVQQVEDSIGYVEYAYAKTTKMTTVKLINAAGQAVVPDLSTFASAAEYANYQPENNYNLILVNQPGKNSWPIVATTFVLLPEKARGDMNAQIKHFFQFAYSPAGDKIARKLDYVGIPAKVVTGIENYWQKAK
ncbi:phosphate ABC transporter substrate-binding protein PstS [Facilibium subflavum]|uniref:phosphate ABC transporter substrate-binding protein PstS n=1 Tax=Facilibium subflavum TaxID=2219058 RepID=UPI000E6514A9|nr:phosphate ABC transporter substrate-binding protein PstS [Facilibium subflavum]